MEKLKELAAALWMKVTAFWRPVALQTAAGLPAPKRRTKKTEDQDEYGVWLSFRGLLDDLDDYFRLLKRLKTRAPSDYLELKNIGVQVVSGDRTKFYGGLPAGWRDGSPRPSWAAVHIPGSVKHDGDNYRPGFAYFRKIKNPVGVKKSNGDVFQVTYYYVQRKDLSHRFSTFFCVFHVAVTPDGVMTLLKEHLPESVSVGKGKKKASFVRQKWSYPRALEVIGEKDETRERAFSPEEVGISLFQMLVAVSDGAKHGAQVTVSKLGMYAVFNIDIKGTAKFFRDRIKTKTETGATKKVFHIVRAHIRASGKAVKFHFRGEREFEWNGYKTVVSMPGYHHVDWTSAPIDLVDTADPSISADSSLVPLHTIGPIIQADVKRKIPVYETRH